MARGTLSAALLVGLGAVVGGAVGTLLSSGGSSVLRGSGAPADAAAPQRVRDFEQRLVVLERKSAGRVRARDATRTGDDASGRRGAPDADDGDESASGVPAPFWSSDTTDGGVGVTTDFVRAVREAIGTIRREDAEAASGAKRDKERQDSLAEVDRRLRDYAERLGLSNEQVTAFHAAAESALDARQEAQARDASRDELAALDRGKERAYRDILGSATHRDFRKLEIDRVARPVIVDIANRAGVDSEQRDRIERLLADHIERYVDPETRLRTEDLDDATRQSIVRDLTAANRDAWDRLRNEILTPEQRDRVPVRLR